MPERDWDAEIDAWTERFRHIPDPPPVFAAAIRDGWDPDVRRDLADEADRYATRHEGWVEQITAFLFDKGGHEDPKPLKANAGKSFQGSIVLGMGFTFDDSGEADDDTPGIPSPIATMGRLIAANPKNAEVIFPYIGGKEVNDSPTHAHHRYVINFGDRSE